MLFNTQPALKQTLEVFEQQKQMIGIRWAGLKFPRGVPLPSQTVFAAVLTLKLLNLLERKGLDALI